MASIEREFEVPLHHADHHIRLAIQQDLGAQNLRVAMESALPRRITQHHKLLVLLVLLAREGAAEQGLNLKRREDAGTEARSVDMRRLARAGQLKASAAEAAQAIKRMRVASVGANN